ncbi:hypothetical protein Q9L58_009385 [Maublancomyces gigas]|uniref:H-type lectin domain-containing protein n=1 Tax=Discina gigas TaxID=1032678 RepID=A0ABR3G7G8_9PEZI
MSCPPLDLAVTPAYRPAPHLLSGPGAFLTSDELTRYFEDFYTSLEFINTAPQMVFERLIGNLCVPVRAAIEKARQDSASKGSGAGITCLKETALAVLPPVVPAPADVEEEGWSTKQHVIRSCTVPDKCSTAEYTKAFLTTGEVYLSRFAIGLTSVRMSSFQSLIASASVTAPKVTGFNIKLSNYYRTPSANRFKRASCSWLELNNQDLDMQCGVWSHQVQQVWDEDEIFTPKNITHNITFSFPYAEAPQVLVWLKRMDVGSSADRSLRVLVSDITTVGFTLEVYPQPNTNICGLDVSWLACSVGRVGVAIGTFEVKKEINARARCEGNVAFQSGWFKTPPRVVVGITGFEIDKDISLGLSVRVVEVTGEGMKWRIDGGEDEDKMAAASGSFIAIE